jgi:hypothetical protein
MDFGYPESTPKNKTQTYYELLSEVGGDEEALSQFFVDYTFPLNGEKYYTDPTYYWYRKNFLELHSRFENETVNCTEGGTLVDPQIPCDSLDSFLQRFS